MVRGLASLGGAGLSLAGFSSRLTKLHFGLRFVAD